MEIISQHDLKSYLCEDSILNVLNQISSSLDERLKCQEWLRNSEAKRYIFQKMYGDLLQSKDYRILDVGGGLTAFTGYFTKYHQYTLIELLNHDEEELAKTFLQENSSLTLFADDWHRYEVSLPFDVIIANDLFPNVDQRLEPFIQKFLPWCKELRLSLTFHNDFKFYLAKRVDADEILCVQSWGIEQLLLILNKYQARIQNFNLNLEKDSQSLFANGRQVMLVVIKGDWDEK